MIEGKYADSLIYKRHSVRRYKDDPVSPEEINHILHAAMASPSAYNTQPWFFLVVDDRKLLDEIPKIHPYTSMMNTAALAIVSCVIKSVTGSNPFYPQDMGACVENMLLAATECSLGSCWCGIHPNRNFEKKFIELFKIPETLFPFCIVAFGRSVDIQHPSDRYDASRVRRNSW